MKFEKIKGLIAAPFSPFDQYGELNLELIDPYAQHLHQSGLIGVFINGSSGEGYMLTVEERNKLAEKWVSAVPEGFKVIVHVGATCTKDSYKMAQHAQEIGAFGIGAMASPFPKAASVEELVKYCEEIACGAPGLPFYFYHIPALNGVYLPMLPFLQVAESRIPNLAGIKYTYENLYEYNQCMHFENGKYDMLYGQDETILNALVMGGAQGGISGTGSYIGKVLVKIIDAYNTGDIKAACELQNFAQDVINVIAKYRGNIVAGKRIMKLLGLNLGINRTPFRNITDEEEKIIKSELDSIDFFNKIKIY